MESKFKAIDYVVVVIILVLSILVGLFHELKTKILDWKNSKSSTSNKINSSNIELKNKNDANENKTSDYLTGNASISPIPIAFSLLASFFSATALLGMPAEVYQYGIQYWVHVFGMMLTPVIGAYITGPLFSKSEALSVFEYLEIRFESKRVRQLGMIYYVIRNLISSAIFMYGPATTLSYLTNLDQKIAIAMIGVIGTFYTTIGGLRAVIWTDLFQAIVMFASLFFIIVKGVVDVGGLKNVWEINKSGGRLNFFDFNPDPFVRQSFWPLVFGIIVYFSQSYCFDQQMIQRFKASKSKKLAQRALLLNVPGIFILTSLCCFVGLVLYANNYKCDPLTSPIDKVSNPNQLVGYFVNKHLNMIPGVAGLFLGSLFCGSLSSVSSSLNSQAAIIWTDFLQMLPYFKKFNDSKSLKANKIIVLICGSISTSLSFLIAIVGGNLTQISISLNGALNTPMIGLFLLGILFKFTNKYGAIIGSLCGLFSGLWISLGAYIVKPYYPKLCVTTDFCYANTSAVDYTPSCSPLSSFTDNASQGFKHFYSMSYMWYTTFGTLNVLIVGVLVSCITGGHKNFFKKNNKVFSF